MRRMPAIFVSHGCPNLPFENHVVVPFLRGLGRRLPKPRAIALISAHWTTCVPTVSTTAKPATLHDFSGFNDRLYQLTYPVPGAPEVACRTFDLLRQALPTACQNPERGLDHGAWIPLLLMFPEAGIPCFQVSLQPRMGTAGAYALGAALAPLREEGVLLLGSGSVVHNLRELLWEHPDPPAWAMAFEVWIEEHLRLHDKASLIDYRNRAPAAARALPTEEHLLPLLVIHGASRGEPLQRLFHGFAHGSLSLSAYGFGDAIADQSDRNQQLDQGDAPTYLIQ